MFFPISCHVQQLFQLSTQFFSEISKVFDPIGFLAPVTFLIKHHMQKLWTAGIDWDDPIPCIKNELNVGKTISLSRRVYRFNRFDSGW